MGSVKAVVTPDCDLQVRFFEAPRDLADCFSVIYRAALQVADGGVIEDQLLPEWANIRLFRGASPVARLPGGMVDGTARMVATGPTTQATKFTLGPTRMWGIGLFPMGIARLTGLKASEVANVICDAEADPRFASLAPLAAQVLDGEPDDEAEARRIFAFFRGRLAVSRHEDQIRAIHEALLNEGTDTVCSLAAKAGIGNRQLERLAKRYFGFPPKALLRRQRFVRTLTTFVLQRPAQWTSAMDSDYYDQAQFTREFREFMGMTPQQYAAMPHPIQDRFLAERARVWGSPAQALDSPDR